MQRTISKKFTGVLSLSLCLQMPPAFVALRAALSAIFRGFSTYLWKDTSRLFWSHFRPS